MSYYICPDCTTPHLLFGSPDKFNKAARDMSIDVLGELPLVSAVSDGGDGGRPVMIAQQVQGAVGLESGKGGEDEVRQVMRNVGRQVWAWLGRVQGAEAVGMRG